MSDFKKIYINFTDFICIFIELSYFALLNMLFHSPTLSFAPLNILSRFTSDLAFFGFSNSQVRIFLEEHGELWRSDMYEIGSYIYIDPIVSPNKSFFPSNVTPKKL